MNTAETCSQTNQDWMHVCRFDELIPHTGICALHNGEQVAIFFNPKAQRLFAVSNYDPIGNANVIARGLTGSLNGQPVVASPLYKQHFNLETGVCLEQPEHRLKTYTARLHNNAVQLCVKTESN